jgi:excisionase family DNA binding protein
MTNPHALHQHLESSPSTRTTPERKLKERRNDSASSTPARPAAQRSGPVRPRTGPHEPRILPSKPEDATQASPPRVLSLLSVKDAAAYMGVNPKTVYVWVAQGRLRCLRAGNRIRFRLCDLERWLGVPERRQNAKAP